MKIKKFLPVIGIALFLYLLFKLDVREIFKEIKNVDISFLLIAIFFILILYVTQTIKWFSIARVQKTKIRFFDAFIINLIGAFYSNITPSKIGGIIRAEYLKKYNNNNLGKGVSNFVLDKVLDLCSLVFLTVLLSFSFKGLVPEVYFYYFSLALVILTMFLLIFQSKKRSKKILGLFYKKLVPKKMKKKLTQGFHSFYDNMPKKRYFIIFFILNILNWIVLYTVTFFVGLSLGIEISYFYFLAILPLTTLVSLIPITISGFGTREVVMISLFSLLGVSATKVFSMSLITFFLGEIMPSFVGIGLIFKKVFKKKRKK